MSDQARANLALSCWAPLGWTGSKWGALLIAGLRRPAAATMGGEPSQEPGQVLSGALSSALSSALLRTLRNHGWSAFRPLQEEAVTATCQRKDVLLVLPTGALMV